MQSVSSNQRAQVILAWEGEIIGGPSGQQRQARDLELQNAQQQNQQAQTNAGRYNAIYGNTQPFYSNLQANGLPFYNNLIDYNRGTVARSFAPAEADLNRRLMSAGALPSGFATGARSDLAAAKAKAFDDSLTNIMFQNQQAKERGAAGQVGLAQVYNPLPFYGGSSSSAAPVMQPLQAQPNPAWGVVGGVVNAASKAIPW